MEPTKLAILDKEGKELPDLNCTTVVGKKEELQIVTKKLIADSCTSCGMLWIMPAEFVQCKVEAKEGKISCPNGHFGAYSQKTIDIAQRCLLSLDTYHKITCCTCGLVFMVTKEFEQTRRETLKPFWCPNNHSQIYTQPKKKEEPKTLQEVDYTKMIQYHSALSGIVLLDPKNKKNLKLAINIARNAIDLAALKEDK